MIDGREGRALMTRRSRTAVACVLACSLARVAGAQRAAADSERTPATLFSRRDALLAAGFAGLTVALLPADRSIAVRLQDSSTQASRFLKNASKGIQYFADPGSVVIGVSMYAVGRL